MMKLGIDGSMDRAAFMKLFERGVKLEPKYLQLYEMKSYYILPRWYGRQGELREFVLATADQCPTAALWVLWRLQHQGVYENVFEQEGIEWKVVKSRLKKCVIGDSIGIGQANRVAFLSNVAGDAEMCTAALKSVDYQIDTSFWDTQERLQQIANMITGSNK